MKMNPEIKALWVAALRGGKYKQGKNKLRSSDNEFCCLGVLCNLHAQAHPEIAAMNDIPGEYCGEEDVLPPIVACWAELDRNPNVHLTKFGNTNLAELNDTYVFSFRKLATVIEKQL
jgi:hypothetical protein